MNTEKLTTILKEFAEDLPPGFDDHDLERHIPKAIALIQKAVNEDPTALSQTQAEGIGLAEAFDYGSRLHAYLLARFRRHLNRDEANNDSDKAEGFEYREVVRLGAMLQLPKRLVKHWIDAIKGDKSKMEKAVALCVPIAVEMRDDALPALRRLIIHVDPRVINPRQMLTLYRHFRDLALKEPPGRAPSLRMLELATLKVEHESKTNRELLELSSPPRNYHGAKKEPRTVSKNFSADLNTSVKSVRDWCLAKPVSEAELARDAEERIEELLTLEESFEQAWQNGLAEREAQMRSASDAENVQTFP